MCFLSWLCYYSMLALHNRPMLEMVIVSFLELYQLFQYSYVCSSVMSVHPEGGGSARDTRVSLTSVDMVSRLAKSCWMSTMPIVCRGSQQVLSEPKKSSTFGMEGRRCIKPLGCTGSSRCFDSDLPVV